VQDIIDLIMPGAKIASPCARSSQIQRGEVTLTGEAMAALQFAACKRVMTVGWDESTKFTDSVFAIYCQLEMYDGSIIEVFLCGLTILPDGGTSAAILAHIEVRAAHLRLLACHPRLLEGGARARERGGQLGGGWRS
jgi:hypothetical protein